jgi:ketose-bisphosphate aldolases
MDNILISARQDGYAVGGFNFNYYDDLSAIVWGAHEMRAPVFAMASEGCVKFLGVKYIVNYMELLKKRYDIKVLLHLDHGRDMEVVKSCIEGGFDSIMYDGSLLGFEENIRNTRMVSDWCRNRGILMEGELGRISGSEENIEGNEDCFTDPDTVEEFVERSGVDSLAVSIGNAHGLYKKTPCIDFERLSRINAVSGVPLVLHGGTGIPFEDVKKAVGLGICKFNVGTEIKLTYINSLKKYAQSGGTDIRRLITNLQEDIKNLIKEYINLLGSSEKCTTGGIAV